MENKLFNLLFIEWALVACVCFIHSLIHLLFHFNFFICDVAEVVIVFESQLSQIWLLIRYMKVIGLDILVFIIARVVIIYKRN